MMKVYLIGALWETGYTQVVQAVFFFSKMPKTYDQKIRCCHYWSTVLLHVLHWPSENCFGQFANRLQTIQHSICILAYSFSSCLSEVLGVLPYKKNTVIECDFSKSKDFLKTVWLLIEKCWQVLLKMSHFNTFKQHKQLDRRCLKIYWTVISKELFHKVYYSMNFSGTLVTH